MEAIADFKSNKGWECPVCHIGLAPTCQACPECIRKRNAPKDSSYATTDQMFNPDNIGTNELTFLGSSSIGEEIPYEDIIFTEAIGKPIDISKDKE